MRPVDEILIVEDEYTERRELSGLMEAVTAPEHIRCAASCEAAIQMIEHHCPDLILLDIMLKGRSGFEVAQFVRSRGLKCRIIILTAYNEFDFASKAMSMGIQDYLLKPMRPDVLLQRIRGVLNRPGDGLTRPPQLWPFLACGMTSCLPEPLPLLPARVMVGLLSAPLSREEGEALSGKAEQALQGMARLECYERRVVCYCNQEKDPEAAAARILALWSPLLPGRCRLEKAGLGELAAAPEELAESYRTARLAACSGALFPQKVLCRYTPWTGEREPYPIQAESRLIHALRGGEETKTLAGRLCAQMLDTCRGDAAILERWLEVYCGALARVCWEAGHDWIPALVLENCFTPESLSRSMEALAAQAAELLLPAGHTGHPLVQRTISIIQTRYREPLKLEGVAREQFVSPAYLGRIFHTHTGQSFRDYLTRVRMQHADQLLRTGSSVSAAACAAGYDDPNYFSRVYKKQFGYPPKEGRG